MSRRTYNFSPGPASLPLEVLKLVQKELLNWKGLGYSIMETNHRTPDFLDVAHQAEQDVRELMNISDNYKILFVSGGASFQFAAVPLNLSGKNNCVDYFHTGYWSSLAIEEAKRYCNVNIVTSSAMDQFINVPNEQEWCFSNNAAYVFYTPNETVHGIRFPSVPNVNNNVPLIADMTSCMLQEEFDVSQFGVIYAGVQKNIAPAGLTIVIIRDDLLDQALEYCPSLLNYKHLYINESIPNTPPTFSWYVAGKTFQWIKDQGGVKEMAKKSKIKSDKLYCAIDRSSLFENNVQKSYRSIINIPFRLKNELLNNLFLSEAERMDIYQLKGHKEIGGMRASLYNAISEKAVDYLIEFMELFEKRYG